MAKAKKNPKKRIRKKLEKRKIASIWESLSDAEKIGITRVLTRPMESLEAAGLIKIIQHPRSLSDWSYQGDYYPPTAERTPLGDAVLAYAQTQPPLPFDVKPTKRGRTKRRKKAKKNPDAKAILRRAMRGT